METFIERVSTFDSRDHINVHSVCDVRRIQKNIIKSDSFSTVENQLHT